MAENCINCTSAHSTQPKQAPLIGDLKFFLAHNRSSVVFCKSSLQRIGHNNLPHNWTMERLISCFVHSAVLDLLCQLYYVQGTCSLDISFYRNIFLQPNLTILAVGVSAQCVDVGTSSASLSTRQVGHSLSSMPGTSLHNSVPTPCELPCVYNKGGGGFARGQFRWGQFQKGNISPPPGILKLAVISW